MLSRRHFLIGFAAAAVADQLSAGSDEPDEQVANGRRFLIGLHNPALDLLPEFSGSDTYWLYHDNYLASKVLRPAEPRLAMRIDEAIRRYGVTGSGKIEIVTGEAKNPFPFRQYKLIDVARQGGKVIRTEIVTETPLAGWEEYADLLLLAAIARATENPIAARESFDAALKLWDGKGFADRVVRDRGIYATYKLALALVAAAAVEIVPDVLPAIRDHLRAMQNDDGGWVTDYRTDLTPVGLANVETTSLAILALDPFRPLSPSVQKPPR